MHMRRRSREKEQEEERGEMRMKSDCGQLRMHRGAKRNIRVREEGERKGEIVPKEFNINIVHAQTAWIPQPCLGNASPTTTWSPFPREKTRPPP